MRDYNEMEQTFWTVVPFLKFLVGFQGKIRYNMISFTADVVVVYVKG